jgi:AcrR family transcriptional regulator
MNVRHRTPSIDVARSILDAAAMLLEQDGPDALSVRRIATSADVAPMGVYNHFESKSGVVDALFRRGFALLHDELEVAHRSVDPEEALRTGLAIYRRLALARPATYRLMLMRAVPAFEPSEESVLVAESAFMQLVRSVDRMMEAGLFAVGDDREIAQRIWAACHGWISLEMFGIGFTGDPDAGYDGLVDVLVAGLRPTA